MMCWASTSLGDRLRETWHEYVLNHRVTYEVSVFNIDYRCACGKRWVVWRD